MYNIAAVLGALALVLLVKPDEVPADILGRWCVLDSNEKNDNWENVYTRQPDCMEHYTLTITQHDVTAVESWCRLAVVMTGGSSTVYTSAECSSLDCRWLASILMYIEHGKLYISGRNSRESCNG